MSDSNANVFENLKVIVFVSQIWGLVPRRPADKFKRYAWFSYSAITTGFYVYVCISYNLHSFARMAHAAANVKLLKKIIYAESTFRCVLLIVVLSLTALKSGHFLRIMEKLKEFDRALNRKLRADIPTRQNFLLQCIYAACIVFFGAYYSVQMYLAKYGWRLSICWALSCNVNLIILSQFTVFVHAFSVRFEIFNTFLANMNIFSIFNVTKLKNYFDYGNRDVSRYRNVNVLSQSKLKELHIVYLSMRDLLHEINSYYSFQILLIVSETVAILIVSISTVTFNITAEDFVIRATHRNLTLIHCGLRLLSIMLLVYMAEKTSKEANYTVSIIHNFLKNEPNIEVKKGLNLFVLDLWHHKVKFDAHDFFDLDYQLIKSILSAATTYVIVLIQFQLATNLLSTKSST